MHLGYSGNEHLHTIDAFRAAEPWSYAANVFIDYTPGESLTSSCLDGNTEWITCQSADSSPLMT